LALGVLSQALAPEPAAAAGRVSQGVYRMGADALWKRGFHGEGQTVAILDQGFGKLGESIAAGVLPPRSAMVTRSFDRRFGLDGRNVVEQPTDHGVRVAEIVHSVAPRARLVLVNYHTIGEFIDAVDWIGTQRIPIVNHSNSFLTPPYNDRGDMARAVNRAARRGVLWVNSAGNFGLRHWAGLFVDRDGDRLADFGGVEGIPIAVAPGDPLFMVLSWPPGFASYELHAQHREPGGAWRSVAVARPEGYRATLSYRARVGGAWRMAIVTRGGRPGPVKLFSRTVSLGRFAVLGRSIPTTGDANGSLTVAAATWDNDRLAQYSSNGPTDDGRPKPDLTGPTDVTVNPRYPRVAGTSTAAPHVAGGAALVRQLRQSRHLDVSPGAMVRFLTTRALDLGARGPDPGYGAGRVRVDTIAPRVVVQVEPRGPRRVVRVRAGARPTVRVTVIDDGHISGVRILEGLRLLATGSGFRFRWRGPRFSRGRHLLTVQSNDLAGNSGRTSITLVVGR
jgi:subtilisin family serine protease